MLRELVASNLITSEQASLSAEMAGQGSLFRTLLVAAGEIGPTDAVPMEYVANALKWVTMHEVGHTLGLRHNFRSSSDTPLDRLADRAWTEQNGVFSSVMDYPAVNLSPVRNVYAPARLLSRGRTVSEIASDVSPSLTSVSAKVASSAAIAMSAAATMPMPPARTGPATSTTTGLPIVTISRCSRTI